MTCEKPCPNCKCKKGSDTLPLDSDVIIEADDGTFLPDKADRYLTKTN